MEALAGLAQLRLLVSVDHVPQNGVADVGHVHPNLVGTAGFQAAPHMGVAPVPLHHLPVGDGILGIALGYAHLFPVCGMAANGSVHRAGVLFQVAADNTLVGSGHGVVLQLGG